MARGQAQAIPFVRLSDVPATLRELRSEGEKLAGRVRKEAVRLATRDGRRTLEQLVDRAGELGNDLERRARRAIADLERQAAHLYERLEAQAKRGLAPLVERLDVPSRRDVEQLDRRVSALEKRVGKRVGRKS